MVDITNAIKVPKTFPEIWQPIASAPRDGTFILVKSGAFRPCIAHFAVYDGRARWGESPEIFMTEEEFLRYWHEVSYEPTEWMHIPDDDVADAIETAYRNGFEDGERHAAEAATRAPAPHLAGSFGVADSRLAYQRDHAPQVDLEGSSDYTARIRAAAKVLLTHDSAVGRTLIYEACSNRVKVYKFDAVLRALATTDGSDNG